MHDDRPAPLVTITDPGRPGEVRDVLGAGPERDPWRLTRNPLALTRDQGTVGLSVVLVLLVGVVSAVVMERRSAQDARDRASVAALALSVAQTSGGYDGRTVPLELQNSGPDAVRVVSVRVDREGYGVQPQDLAVDAGASAIVPVRLEAECPMRRGLSDPSGVLLRVRTVSGVETTVRVPTRDTQFSADYTDAQVDACGLFAVEDSISSSVTSLASEPRSVTAVLDLANQAGATREVLTLQVPGFQVAADLPLSLAGDRGQSSTPVTVRFTVDDCENARDVVRRVRPRDTAAPYQLLEIDVELSGDGLEVFTFVFGSEQLSRTLTKLVARSC